MIMATCPKSSSSFRAFNGCSTALRAVLNFIELILNFIELRTWMLEILPKFGLEKLTEGS